ncbi:fibroblast growth factor receptor 3-like [Dermacentor andersoni]|uniref:fibroblast growth factor receptor 3-like n=1 Tax=Dermacentor andersoni TaxID=34620 RepID=UPI0021552549|nr:fibroblast growth factor receptor 3-like [Dermacentor andersoni]
MNIQYCLILLLGSLLFLFSEYSDVAGETANDKNYSKPVFNKTKVARFLAFVQGENVSLDCKATGNPHPSVQWTLNGTSLKGTKHKVNPSNNRLRAPPFVLRIRGIQKNDSGKYKCKVSNSQGSIQRTFTVIVMERKRTPPVITEISGNQTVCEGDNITLRCKAESDLTPYLTWMKQRPVVNEVFASEDITVPKQDITVRQGDAVYMLIKNASKSDSGQYVCTAENIFGYTNRSTWVSVLASGESNT